MLRVTKEEISGYQSCLTKAGIKYDLSCMIGRTSGEIEMIVGELLKGEDIEDWYFTFSGDGLFSDRYIKIKGTAEGARKIMFATFSDKWCMQYCKEEFDEIQKKYCFLEELR